MALNKYKKIIKHLKTKDKMFVALYLVVIKGDLFTFTLWKV